MQPVYSSFSSLYSTAFTTNEYSLVSFEGFKTIFGFYGQIHRWEKLRRNVFFFFSSTFVLLLIKRAMHTEKPLEQNSLFFASQQYSADQFPFTCSDSPHFEEAALRLYYHSSSRQGLIKLTGVITRPPPCHCSERKMEQRCDGEGHEVINPAVCSMGFPCDTLSLQI